MFQPTNPQTAIGNQISQSQTNSTCVKTPHWREEGDDWHMKKPIRQHMIQGHNNSDWSIDGLYMQYIESVICYLCIFPFLKNEMYAVWFTLCKKSTWKHADTFVLIVGSLLRLLLAKQWLPLSATILAWECLHQSFKQDPKTKTQASGCTTYDKSKLGGQMWW